MQRLGCYDLSENKVCDVLIWYITGKSEYPVTLNSAELTALLGKVRDLKSLSLNNKNLWNRIAEGIPYEEGYDANYDLLMLENVLLSALHDSLWFDSFDKIWSENGIGSVAMTLPEYQEIDKDMPKLLKGDEVNISQSSCDLLDSLEDWAEDNFNKYCGEEYEKGVYPSWYSLEYINRKETKSVFAV